MEKSLTGWHLYRVKFCFRSDGLQFLMAGHMNVVVKKRGLAYAGPKVTSLMQRPSFREKYPEAIVRDIIYLGTIE